MHETHLLEENEDPSVIMKVNHNDEGNPNDEPLNRVEKAIGNFLLSGQSGAITKAGPKLIFYDD